MGNSSYRGKVTAGILLLSSCLLSGCGNQDDHSYPPEGQLKEELSVLEKGHLVGQLENVSAELNEGNFEEMGKE